MGYMTKPLQSGIAAATAKSARSAAGQAANLPPTCFIIGKIAVFRTSPVVWHNRCVAIFNRAGRKVGT